jgi:hypothetical protein
MALMVLLDASGETATYEFLEKWQERLAKERHSLTPVVRN